MTLTPDADRATRVFLSYSRTDEATVIKLATALEASNDIEVLRDKEDILPAEDWRVRLQGLVIAADALVFCLSSASLRSREALWEIETAERLSKRILPVALSLFDEPAPSSISKLNYIFLTDPAKWDDGLATLRSAIYTDIGWIRDHTRIGELAGRWDAGGRHGDDLLRGAALDTAEHWLTTQPQHAPPPSLRQREFITTSRRAATTRQRRWVAGSLTVAAVAVCLSVLAYWQRGVAVAQRTLATARRLSAEAQLGLADTLAGSEIPVRNLLVSLSLTPSAATIEALAAGVNRLQPRLVDDLPWPADASELRLLAFSQDAAWLGAITANEAFFWDILARQLILRCALPKIDATPTLVFAQGTALALVGLRSAAMPDTAAAWVWVDLASAQAHTLTSAEALDMAVEGSKILGLEKTSAGLPVIVDLTGGATIVSPQLPEGFGSVVFGRFFTSAVEAPMIPLPIAMLAAATPPSPMVVLVDDKGSVVTASLVAGVASPLPLPPTAQPLATSGANGVLAVRLQNTVDAVISLKSGEQIWKAPDPKTHFRGFAGNGRFIIVEDAQGAHLESLGGGPAVHVENSRRTDYDMNALNDITRYTPIIAAEVAEQSGQIVIAWKDGRIAIWEATQRPRYGSFGAMPMPSFEALARFDHGETLGATVTWSEPPALFVAPTGRYVASQSMGIKANPVGTLTAYDPLVRIWDSHRGGEIARFRPGGPMVAAFSPTDAMLVTATARMNGTGQGRPPQLRLWDLREPGPTVEETRQTATIALTPPAAKPGIPDGAADHPSPLAPYEKSALGAMLVGQPTGGIWAGADLRLRAFGPHLGETLVIDDLTPVLGNLLNPLIKELPAEAPLPALPLRISADGRRALLGFGRALRLYALDDKPRLLHSIDLGLLQVAANGSVVGLALSRDGSNFAAALLVTPTHERPPTELAGAPPNSGITILEVKLLVLRANENQPIREISQSMIVMGPVMRLRERLLALGPDARIGVMDEMAFTFDPSAPPSITARLVVRDMTTNTEMLALPPRRLTVNPFGSWEEGGAGDPVVAFDPTGTRMAVMRDRPDCPMKTEVNPLSWMPRSVPACPERRIELALWDLPHRKRIAETSLQVSPAIPGNRLVAGIPPIGMMGMPNAGPASPFTLDLPNPLVATLDSSEARMIENGGDQKLEVARVHRRVLIEQQNPVIGLACERLPRELAQIDQSTWIGLVPDETYRAICPHP